MSLFWIIGIVLNAVFFALAMYWIVKQWRLNKSGRQRRDSDPKS